jgi:hypothetical protein
MPREGSIEMRELTADEISALEARGYKHFMIGRGRFAPIMGYAEDERDVGELRSRFVEQEEARSAKRST